MKPPGMRSLTRIAVVGLLLAGIVTPVLCFGQPGASAQTQTQLAAMLGVAQASRSYAYSTVNSAASHELSVSSAQAKLAEGDSLLATAEADAQQGNNLAAGIHAAQAAMDDYTSAAVSASIALANAHLTLSVDYSAAVGAVTEVNATASFLASVAARACASGTASASGAGPISQACAELTAQDSAAAANLKDAASLLEGVSSQANATASLSQAMALVSMAREEVTAGQADLLTVASYGYSARAQSYIASVVLPLSAEANATIRSEQSLQENLAAVQGGLEAYAKTQAPAVANVTASLSALAEAIAQVNPAQTSSSVNSSASVASAVNSDMSALLSIPGIAALPSVSGAIQSCSSASSTYGTNLASAAAESNLFSGRLVASFGAYLDTIKQDYASVVASGSSFSTAYQAVIGDINTTIILAIPGVQSIFNDLTSLQVGSSVAGADSSLQAETGAMERVEGAYNSATAAIASSKTSILMNSTLLATASSISNQGPTYLNLTAAGAVSTASDSIQTVVAAARSFMADANASMGATIGTLGESYTVLLNEGESLNASVNRSVTCAANAMAYVGSDASARVTEAASGRAQVSEALVLFSNRNIASGVSALAQGTLDLQAAASTGV